MHTEMTGVPCEREDRVHGGSRTINDHTYHLQNRPAIGDSVTGHTAHSHGADLRPTEYRGETSKYQPDREN
jgi:hypothetical protein